MVNTEQVNCVYTSIVLTCMNLSYRTPIAPPPSNQQNSITQSMDWDYYDDDTYDTESYMVPPPPPPSYTQR